MHVQTIIPRGVDAPLAVAWLDLPGNAMDRPARVFLHGLGSSSIATVPRHARERAQDAPRSLLVDAPGFGHSRDALPSWGFTIEEQAGVIAAVLRELEIGPATIIGHSMGGSIAIALASRHPEVVSSLIVAEPNLDPGTGTLSAHIASQTEHDFLARGYDRLVHVTARQAQRAEGNAASFLPTLRQALPAAMYRASVSLLANRAPTFRDQLLAIGSRIPTTFLYGSHTPGLTGLDALASAGVTVVEIPDAGHVMMDDNPAAFFTQIRAAEDRAATQ